MPKGLGPPMSGKDNSRFALYAGRASHFFLDEKVSKKSRKEISSAAFLFNPALALRLLS